MIQAIVFHIGVTDEERAALPKHLVPGATYLLKWSRLPTPMRAQLRLLPEPDRQFFEFWVFLEDDFQIGPEVPPSDTP